MGLFADLAGLIILASFLIGSSGGTAGRTVVPLWPLDVLRLPLDDDLERDREDDRLDDEERPPFPRSRPLSFLSEALGDRDFDSLLRLLEAILVLVCLFPTSSASAALKLLALFSAFEGLSSFSFLIRDKFISLFCNGAVFLASASGLADRRLALRRGIPSGDEDRDLEREDLELADDDRPALRLLFGLRDLLEDDLDEDLEEPDE